MATVEEMFAQIDKDTRAIPNLNAALRKADLPELSPAETGIFKRRLQAEALATPYPLQQEQATRGRQFGGTELFNLGRQDLLPEADTREADRRELYNELFQEYVAAKGVLDESTAQRAVDMVNTEFTEEERVKFGNEVLQGVADANAQQLALDFTGLPTNTRTDRGTETTETQQTEPAAPTEETVVPAPQPEIKETQNALQEQRQEAAQEVTPPALPTRFYSKVQVEYDPGNGQPKIASAKEAIKDLDTRIKNYRAFIKCLGG